MLKLFPIVCFFCISTIALAQSKADRTANFPTQEKKVNSIPVKENLWVFILAGQSNMAGRGFVEPQDTIPSTRVLSINKNGELIYAKEPLHFYEPTMAGLDVGLTFGKTLLQSLPDSVSVLIIPTAVGGSAIDQWLENQTFRGVPLYSNFEEKVALAKKYGTIKGLIWHQGESDSSSEERIAKYSTKLAELMSRFRKSVGQDDLPIILGELGAYSKHKPAWKGINAQIEAYGQTDPLVRIVHTADLEHKGDFIHFNTESVRKLGKRYAQTFIDWQIH
ncbi:sialate O-acetylesterase [Marinilongibacter aquaticus]|uniref:sialate O-acetylesterase n=1 Tax=Marinilongibacter aquaticus TaxID=2975157 RepID=UPI0021BD1303|nr:sialate O-acetylesterase [Marinilongibacter aquaticus]UBM59079.1 sialate O-acetylesterase [Marinilongibacter aquaticus]